ncbi:MAG: NADP-specific glutamate dehydrogenase [Actinomycetota bacterium]
MGEYVRRLMADVTARNANEPEFLQAVREAAGSIELCVDRFPVYRDARVLERFVEPERVITFRVSWVDDRGQVQVNRGYRVEMSSAIGPYKGGLRFHPTVYLGMLKFLAFEQVFKNALTTLPLGAGKGGADFDPKGKSEQEVMRFCQAFMTGLHRHIGPNTDVPAGDIGVGGREIGYLFGQYKRITNEFTGAITGKGLETGGSLIRPEATGYGAVYFAQEMLGTRDDSLEGKNCLVSGSGNVAQYTVEKLIHLGARPVTLSDSGGFVHDPDGIDEEKLAWVMDLKNERRGRIMAYAERFPTATFTPADPSDDHNALWEVPADCAFPSATQNEINGKDAANLISNGVFLVSEGANMPTEPEGIDQFVTAGVLYGPGKAANAGGVAVSGLEMSQNAMRLSWTREGVDQRLREIMRRIHEQCRDTADEYGEPGNYVHGANIAGFRRVADAMLAQGVI